MRRSAAVLAALALLAALAWLGSSFLSSSPQARAAQPAAASAARAAPAPAADVLAAPDAERPRPGAGEAEPAPQARVALREEQPAGPTAACRLLVVDGASGAPVPGARVLWTPVDPEEPWLEHPSWDLEACDAWLAEHGREGLSAADGTLELPLAPDGEANVLAFADGKAGREHATAKRARQETLELWPDAALDVLVRDVSGRPLAGVQVELVQLGRSWGKPTGMHARVTDAEGRARYAHLGLAAPFTRESWGVGVPSVLGGPPPYRIEPDRLPSEPVVLLVPATGAVEIELREGAAGSDLEGVHVALLLDEGVEDERLSFWTRPDSVEKPVEDGRARFEHVALGRDLIVEAGRRHRDRPTRTRLRGPMHAGQVVRAALTLGQDHPVLRLRVLDASGEPLAGHALSWSVDGAADDFQKDSELGPDGVLLAHLSARDAGGSGRTLKLSVAARGERRGGKAELALPDALDLGLCELGEVRVSAGALLVAGTVRGPDGAPRAGVDVRVEAVREWGEGNRYHEDLDLGVESAGDGSFVAMGDAPSARLRVSAGREERWSKPIEVDVGTTGVLLDLQEPGSMAGRVLLDEGIVATRLGASARPSGPGGENEWRDHRSEGLAPDGSFELTGLRPGTYDLHVDSGEGRSNTLALAGLEVPPGAACGDPRLGSIDLRGRLLAIRVELVTPSAGERVMGTIGVRLVGAAADAENASVFLQGPQADVIVEARAVDLTVDVQGFRRVELSGVREDVRVELRPGLAVRLRIPDDVPLPRPPQYLKAFLAPPESGSSLAFGHFLDTVFDERREILVRAPVAGRLELHWLFEERAENSLSTSNLDPEEPSFVEVLDLEGEQVFEVEPPRKALADRLGDG